MKQIIFAAIALSTSIAHADDKTDTKLAQLVGRWEGTSEFNLRGTKTTWKVSTSCERAVSQAVLCTLSGSSGASKLEETWMFGYDQNTDTYHLFMTNNWGEAYDHAAKWKDAATVSFIHRATRDKKPLVEDYTLTFKGDQMIYKGKLEVGGKAIGEGTTASTRVK